MLEVVFEAVTSAINVSLHFLRKVSNSSIGVAGRKTRESPEAPSSKPGMAVSSAARLEIEFAAKSVLVELAVGVPTMRTLAPDSKTSAPERIAEAFEVEESGNSKTAPDFIVTLDTLVPDRVSVPLLMVVLPEWLLLPDRMSFPPPVFVKERPVEL